uniref:Uncharacterized protein n=1 Tax=Romanomermis culicivorax TaxID=13658 RepID=A0A915KJJ7_ROMCU
MRKTAFPDEKDRDLCLTTYTSKQVFTPMRKSYDVSEINSLRFYHNLQTCNYAMENDSNSLTHVGECVKCENLNNKESGIETKIEIDTIGHIQNITLNFAKANKQILRSLGRSAVVVQDVEIATGDQFATVDTRLNGSDAAQGPHLFDVADERCYFQTFQFRIDGMQTADQMFEENLVRLRQTDHRFAVDDESGHLLTS